jgi:beta-glucosidase
MQIPDFSQIEDVDEFVETVLSFLSVEEKVLLLAGKDAWRTNDIPRLGVSSIKTSDGPVGVRGSLYTDGVAAAHLPSGVSLAATFDEDVLHEVSTVLADEAKSKEVDVLLGPTGRLAFPILVAIANHSFSPSLYSQNSTRRS